MPRKKLLKTAPLEGTRFPLIQARLLDGRPVEFPAAARGGTSLLLVALMQQEPGVIDSWVVPLEREFGAALGWFRVALLDDQLAPDIIDDGMRHGITADKHGRIATSYGPRQELIQRLAIEDGLLLYVYLLDRGGVIRWWGWGRADQKQLAEITAAARRLRPGTQRQH
jgi:hypothetical protein